MSTEQVAQVPFNVIAGALGIEVSTYNDRCLHVDCDDGQMVTYLRRYGIAAEGFGAFRKPDGFPLFGYSSSGSFLPRPDNSYDLVFSYQPPDSGRLSILYVDNEHVEFLNMIADLVYNALFNTRTAKSIPALVSTLASEAVRVLKPGKKLVFWPEPPFVETARELFQKRGMVVERVPAGNANDIKDFTEDDRYLLRTELTKPL